MIRQWFSVAVVLAAFLFSPLSDAQLRFGKSIPLQAAVCVNKSDAISIAETDANKGWEVAGALFSKSDCAVAQFHATLVKVVFQITDTRDANRVVRVIEVIVALPGGKVTTAYILTDADIPDARGV